MNKENYEKYAVIINFTGVILAFIGVFLGAYLVSFYQNKMYEAERFDKRIERKEQILEETYRVYGRMPEIRFWQTEINVIAADSITAQNWIYELDKQRNPILAEYSSKLLTVNKLGVLYFGSETQELINTTFFKPDRSIKNWWDVPNEQLNMIAESMAKEIRKDIKRGL